MAAFFLYEKESRNETITILLLARAISVKIKVKNQINIQVEDKTQIISKRVAIRDIESFVVSTHYGATLLSVDYDKQIETVDLLLAVNPSRKHESQISFMILSEGDFLPVGNWKMLKTLTSNFTTTKRYLFVAE